MTVVMFDDSTEQLLARLRHDLSGVTSVVSEDSDLALYEVESGVFVGSTMYTQLFRLWMNVEVLKREMPDATEHWEDYVTTARENFVKVSGEIPDTRAVHRLMEMAQDMGGDRMTRRAYESMAHKLLT